MAKKRRANGEGSLTERRDGRWMARFTVQTPSGSKQKTLYARTRREASDKMIAAQAASIEGTLVFGDSTTLGAFLTTWLEGMRTTLKASSIESYERAIKNHLSPALGGVRLSKLSAPQIHAYYAQKLAAGLAPATVRVHYAILHKALKQAARWHLIVENPAALVSPPKATPKEMNPLDRDEVRVFLDAVRGHRHEALYTLAVTTGARIGELVALRWSDFDEARGSMHISRTLSSAKSGPRYTSPKSGKSRTVSLPTVALDAIRRHRVRQNEQRLRLGTSRGEHDLIFPGRDGVGPLNPDTLVRHNFKPLLERAGLPQRTFHDLRHTSATLLLSRGVHPKFVQEMLGHATIAQTLDRYSHVMPSMSGVTAIAMDQALA